MSERIGSLQYKLLEAVHNLGGSLVIQGDGKPDWCKRHHASRLIDLCQFRAVKYGKIEDTSEKLTFILNRAGQEAVEQRLAQRAKGLYVPEPYWPGTTALQYIDNLTDHGKILSLLVQIARSRHDGHLTVLRFTTNWRVGFGTPEDRIDIDLFSEGPTFADAARKAVEDESLGKYDYERWLKDRKAAEKEFYTT